MRKLVLTLAVVALFAAPALATVTISGEADAGNARKIWIKYESDEAELVRAFALDIQATGGDIIECNDYEAGDDNGKYGIFPGSFAAAPIQVDAQTGEVVSWEVDGYSPVAPAGDPDALGDIPGPGITIEMGSLYDTNPPGDSGYLCSVTCDENVTELCITANAIRGKVVLESAAEVQELVVPDGTSAPCIAVGEEPPCLPSDHPDYDEWVNVGKPQCWCYPRQCRGDADGLKEGSAFFGYMYVGGDDLDILIDAWKILDPPKGPGCTLDQHCADFSHSKEGSAFFGYMRVGGDDLDLLIANWKVLEEPKGPGTPPDCGGSLEP
jgi:hypothetical protein